MRWMNHKKSRVMDFFRRIDKDQDGKITRQEFIDGILASSTSIITTHSTHGPMAVLPVHCTTDYVSPGVESH